MPWAQTPIPAHKSSAAGPRKLQQTAFKRARQLGYQSAWALGTRHPWSAQGRLRGTLETESKAFSSVATLARAFQIQLRPWQRLCCEFMFPNYKCMSNAAGLKISQQTALRGVRLSKDKSAWAVDTRHPWSVQESLHRTPGV